MKNYFKKKTFVFAALLTLSITVGFIINAQNNSKQHPAQEVFNSVISAPLNNTIAVLDKDVLLVNQKLENSGFVISNLNSIKEISEKTIFPLFRL